MRYDPLASNYRIAVAGAVPPPKGSAVLAYAPHCPVPREERWYVVLADAAHNVTLTWNTVTLSEAESAAVEEATVSGRSGRNRICSSSVWSLCVLLLWCQAYLYS